MANGSDFVRNTPSVPWERPAGRAGFRAFLFISHTVSIASTPPHLGVATSERENHADEKGE